MKIFLTGGSGFLGNYLIQESMKSGDTVKAIKSINSTTRIKLQEQPEWLIGNLEKDWSEQLSECDTFVHLAAAGVNDRKTDWDHCFQINLIQTIFLMRQAIKCGIKRYVICGSCFEYGTNGENFDKIPPNTALRPFDAYSSSKAAASMASIGLAKEYNLKLLIIRPFHLYGEGEAKSRFWPSLIRAGISGADFPMTLGEQIRDFTNVKNAAKDLIKHIHNLDQTKDQIHIQHLGSGKECSLLEFAKREWDKCNAKGRLLPGQIMYRRGECMRYVPSLVRYSHN